MRKKLAVGAVVCSIILAFLYGAAPWAVREYVKDKAKERGVDAKIGTVEVRWGSVTLRDVELRAKRQVVKARTVSVKAGLDGVREVNVTAVRAELKGRRGEIEEAFGRKNGGDGTKKPINTSVTFEELRWEGFDGSGGSVKAFNGWVRGEKVAAIRAEIEAQGVRAMMKKPEWDGKSRTLSLETAEMSVGVPVQKGREENKGGQGKQEPVRITAGFVSVKGSGEEMTVEGVDAKVERGRADISAKAVTWPNRTSAHGVSVRALMENEKIDVTAGAESVEASNAKVARGELIARGVRAEIRAEIKGANTEIKFARITVGPVVIRAEGELEETRAEIKLTMDEVGCQQLLEYVPSAISGRLMPDTVVSGNISWKVEVKIDLPFRKKPDVAIKLRDGCVVENMSEAFHVKKVRSTFQRDIYEADGKSKKTVTSGPGTASWVPLSAVSQYVPEAVRELEDPGFYAHRGFLVQAFENSLIQNIQAGKFVRGGSTVTMQLAKNMWLTREKTLSRKFQELVLTKYLEQSMTKQEIMEYYLNLVEFGPNIYGVGPAASHYFGKHPLGLTLSQSLFLASLLPNPRGSHFGAEGKLGERRLEFIRRMMKKMAERGTVSEAELERGLSEIPRLGVPGATSEPAPVGDAVGDGIDPSEWR